jgi:hypothetical protein
MRADDLRNAQLPVDSLKEALPHLRRPFTAAACRWKVQSSWDTGGLVVAYIDARLVIERLNAVVGAEWEDRYDPAGEGLMWCHLNVFGKTRSDIGQSSGPMGSKGRVSDALKRAGVKYGIGVSVYAMKSASLDAAPNATGNKLQRKQKGQKTYVNMTPGAENWLRQAYGKWLRDRAEGVFGPALDHGDEIGAQGADDEPAAAAPEPAEPAGEPVLRDERAAELTGQAEALYAEIRKMNAATFPPAKYRADRDAASTSHEALEAFVERLTGIRDEMKAARS